MAIPYSDQRVAIFVDVQNVYHSAKNLHHARVNFKELLRAAVGNRPLLRAVAYVVKSDTALGEESFFEALKKTGFELRLKDLQIYPDGSKKADWDVGMAVDAVRLASSVDAIILVTGDGDFVPLVEYLKWGLGKQVEVVAFRRSASGKLKESVDRFTDLESVPRILLKIRERKEKKTNQ
ncbi:MAG: NYN domain-containing protein [Candidatus Jorgensenbacteria bacterium]|nr:NYN domain-containing protein [Candidatus Jorgensenbacteria bacterium]